MHSGRAPNEEEDWDNVDPDDGDDYEPYDDENGLAYGDDEEDDDELPSDNPLFVPLQNMLQKQLDEEWDKLDVACRDNIAAKGKLTENRENVGVELYSVQQTLGKLQQRLTDANEEKTQWEQVRVQQEEEVQEAREELDDASADYKQQNQDYESNRKALEQLNDVVIRLEQHNQEIKNQVAVTRRETYKSEQAASEAELTKQEQDLYIDKLTGQVQDITANLSTIESQILAQRGETKTARDALLQASLEMEKISFERNHLLQELNSSLISVQRRAKTLTEIESAAAQQEEEIRALQNENSGLKTQVQQQHDLSERNQTLLNKINARVAQLDGKIRETHDKRKQLEERLCELTEQTKRKEQDVSRLLIEKNQAQTEFHQSTKGTNEVSNQIHELEDGIIKHTVEQGDRKRDTTLAHNAVQKVREQISGKDRELSNLQNEVVRLRIDRLNIVGQMEKLERGKNDIVEELKQKDNLIGQYDLQKKRNNVEIAKRQSDVDRLNRLYDSLKQQQNGEEYGPLERKIRVLQSKIVQSEENSQASQAQWLKKQTELVAMDTACETIDKSNTDAIAHIAVLSRRRDRTRNQLHATEKEIDRYKIHIKLLQREMSRLGVNLSQFSDNGNVLVEGNINFEAEILEGLRRKEEEAASAESRIEDLANQREVLADELMEKEKAIMLHEKKLQLAKEMKEALDPNYGAQELRGMRKEISRMELRLKQIKKQQTMIITEMEHALKRRETIATRGAVQKRLNKDKTRADVAHGITEIKRDVKKIHDEAVQQDAMMKEHLAVHHELEAEVETLAQIQRDLTFKKSEVEKNLHSEEQTKVLGQIKLERLQGKARLLTTGTTRTKVRTPEAYDTNMRALKSQESSIREVIGVLQEDFPHLKPNFDIVQQKMVPA